MLNITKDSFETWPDFKKKLEKVYYLFASLPLVVFLIGYAHNQGREVAALSKAATWALILVELLLFLTFYFRFKPKRQLFKGEQQSKTNMVVYYAVVSRYALVFSLFGLINVCLFTFTGLNFFAAMYCIHLLFTSLEMPNLHKMARLLKLNETQVKALFQGKPIT